MRFSLLPLFPLSTSLLTIGLAFASCRGAITHGTSSNTQKRIVWDLKTLTLIQEGGNYGRIIRLLDGRLLCAYDVEARIWIRHSGDEGKTWSQPVLVAASAVPLTNVDLLQLKSGSVLCFFNGRPEQGPDQTEPFTIQYCRSENAGQSWTPAMTLYRADMKPENGCWEPAGIELPSGEVQVFFANENPYRKSHEQEITVLRSLDGGRSWKSPETACFRAHARDGMPSPLVLQNGEGIAMAIEDNGLSGSFKPVIIFTSMADNWRSGAVRGDSPNRWRAHEEPLTPEIYAGAPCLRQMPTGETILSYQQHDKGDVDKARMTVCIGNSSAQSFSRPSHPFPHDPEVGQLWNALFVKNKNTVAAISSTRINGVWGLWTIDGHLR